LNSKNIRKAAVIVAFIVTMMSFSPMLRPEHSAAQSLGPGTLGGPGVPDNLLPGTGLIFIGENEGDLYAAWYNVTDGNYTFYRLAYVNASDKGSPTWEAILWRFNEIYDNLQISASTVEALEIRAAQGGAAINMAVQRINEVTELIELWDSTFVHYAELIDATDNRMNKIAVGNDMTAMYFIILATLIVIEGLAIVKLYLRK